MNSIEEVRKKKEFSEIPDSVVERILLMKGVRGVEGKEKIKKARAILRRVFTSVLTEKILRGKIKDERILKKHISTKYRDYDKLYKRILDYEKSILDLGCGVNGFSYKHMKKKIEYLGVEVVGQVVRSGNEYFKQNKISGRIMQEDLFDLKKILELMKKLQKPRTIFMFNIIDSLEIVEKNYSKKLILEVGKEGDKIILSFPTRTLAKRERFKARRYWLYRFLKTNFTILDEFEMQGEKFIVFQKL
jgi:hypothetical protein